MRIFTIGYEGTTVGEFLDTLREAEVERAVDVILAAFLPPRGHPGLVHVDAVAVDDGGDRVEEGEGAFAAFRRDCLGEL